jgi:homoserine dehydrogenase
MKIGLLGCGTVGSGVYEIISQGENKKFLKDLEVVKILVKDQSEVTMDLMTTNPADVLENDEIDLIVEVMGGINPAFDFISKALSSGKHVVTANKAVVAKHLKDFNKLAEENNAVLLYEASVGGGIPIIKSLKQAMRIDDVTELDGILNGTTNFILYNMYENNYEFDNILRLAQSKGYAEADPSADIDGGDIKNKIDILSSIAYEAIIPLDDIYTFGIRNVSKHDIDYFKKQNLTLKMLANSVKKDGNYCASVQPVLYTQSELTGSVTSNFNIAGLFGETIGDLKFYGQGAGKFPTANAVVQDIIDVASGSHTSYPAEFNKTVEYDGNLLTGKYYARIHSEDKEIVKKIEGIFKNVIEDKIHFREYYILNTKEIDQNQFKKLAEAALEIDEQFFMARYN